MKKVNSRTNIILTENNDLELKEKVKKANYEIINNIKYILKIVEKFYPEQLKIVLEEVQKEDEMKNSSSYMEISKA